MDVINERAIRRLRFAFGCVVVLAAGLVVLIFSLGWFFDPFHQQRFDTKSWAGSDRDARLPMARSAIRKLRDGLSKAEVVNSLGRPDGEPSVVDARLHNEALPANTVETFVYQLGTSGLASALYGFDTESFIQVYFDGEGRVVGSGIIGW